MKKITLACLCATVLLLPACGGSEQQSANGSSPATSNAVMSFGSLSEASDYLASHYSEEQLKAMYLEFAALSRADTELYYEKDESGIYVDPSDEESEEILKKMNENISAVMKEQGINHQLFAALMMYVRNTDWPISMDEQILARAEEINAGRSESN